MNKNKDFFERLGDLLKETDSLKENIPSIHKSGYPFIFLFFLATILLSFFSDLLGWMGILFSLWCVYFFRDPERVTPQNENILVSPADGRVLSISDEKSPENLSVDKNEEMKKISIFMNVFNVHVNRLPVSGKVVWLKYVPGAFFNASLDKSSKDNERMISKIEIKKNKFIYVVQIAGLIARRIKCDLEGNQNVIIGERFGIIRFGSRLDVYLPKDFSVDVLEGQTTIAGETIISHMDSNNKNIKNK